LQRRLVGNSVKPVGYHLPRRNGSGLAKKDKKCGLKRILGVMVVEEAATNSPYQWAVPLDERSEGCFVMVVNESPQELPIGQYVTVSQEGSTAKPVDHFAQFIRRHVFSSAGRRLPATYYLPLDVGLIQYFRPVQGFSPVARILERFRHVADMCSCATEHWSLVSPASNQHSFSIRPSITSPIQVSDKVDFMALFPETAARQKKIDCT
jgi:hypothetical protein